MNKVLIYAGTTEGRELALKLQKYGIYSDVRVATEYGNMTMEATEFINVEMGRLDILNMKELYSKEKYVAIIDATHPFATKVSENIRLSAKDVDIPLIRVVRETYCENEDYCTFFENIDECVATLEKTDGNILLTTGSKELAKYTENEQLRSRIFARVLPGLESIKLCYDAGLLGKQIIAMQGPFSKEMNLLTLKEYDIKCMVTKESGKTGGVDSKIEAAKELGISCYILRNPEKNEDVNCESNKENVCCDNNENTNCEKYVSLDEAVRMLQDICGIDCANEGGNVIDVVLAGIGMGSKCIMTNEVSERINDSDCIFGAARMLEGISGEKVKYPYYLFKDIIPVIEQMKEGNRNTKVTVLFSGDSGFFSGCDKLYKELKKIDGIAVKIMPGISSISYFASRIGINWQDANIISTHGFDKNVWISRLKKSININDKTFFITSGYEDINLIGDLVKNINQSEEKNSGNNEGSDLKENFVSDLEMYVGYNLSYDDEFTGKVSADDCKLLSKEGLYVGMILNNSDKHSRIKRLTPYLTDDMFIRDKVPMTKEEIRHISVCKLGVFANAVVYDIGSGTGSIAIEVAKLDESVNVYAVETKSEAVALIEQNVLKHGANNVKVINGIAPMCLSKLPAPDLVFIGGSKGQIKDILKYLINLGKEIKVVMNAVSIETICEMNEVLKEFEVENLDISQINVSKAKELGSYHLLQANNPVFVYSFNIGKSNE